MERFNIRRVKYAIALFVLFAVLCASSTVLAQDLESNLSEDFQAWLNLPEEEKTEFNMPIAYNVELSDSYLTEYLNRKSIDSNDVPDLKDDIVDLNNVGNINLESVGASSSDSSYSLRSAINMRVEDQKSTNECWAFSILKSMETNIALTSNSKNLMNFSERHMDYACSKTFSDGIYDKGFSREVGNGGLPIIGLAYLTNGSGAVLESVMPFEDNERKIPLSSIDKPVDTVVTDYVIFPQIRKEVKTDANGNTTSIKYSDGAGTEYTSLRIEAIRNQIKEHIVKYGSVTSMTAGSKSEFYNNRNIYKATTYNCNNNSIRRDHAISIVGWDDNYSRDNFSKKPLTDGAYIIQNSYGTSSFDNGYMYISYEDVFIEDETYGVCGTSSVNYDKIYQNDYYGGVYQLGSSSTNVGYIATNYERNSASYEYIDSVGVQVPQETKLEIFINPNDSKMDSASLTKVGETGYLPSGYHKVDITKTQLKGSTFAIVVKQTSKTGKFYFSVETKVDGTAYAGVSSENKSFYSIDGLTYTNLKNVKVNGLDGPSSDVCIKAFAKGGLIPEDPKPDDPVQPEDPKPDDPVQPEDPKPEDPKPEDPVQPEDPKPEDPKPEDPKPEDPKPEDPKPEDPKPEDPKPEDPKPEDPKPEDPKPEDPKPEDPKPEDPKPEDPKPEDPKPEDPKPEDPKPEQKYFKSDVYKEDNNYYRNIEHSTTVAAFKKNIKTNYDYKILDLNGNDVTNVKANIKTGYKLKYGEKELILVVKGDINRDGIISITDIGQQLYHFLEKKGYVLTGDRLMACDINLDNQVTITDLTQLMFIFEDID